MFAACEFRRYTSLEKEYQIDLYKIGNDRLVDFIGNQLPNIKNESTPAKLLLILNYIKYEVEADDHYWLERLQKAYTEKASDVKKVADSLLPVVHKLANRKDAQFFKLQYRNVLQIIDTHFGVPTKLWPIFCASN